MSETIVKEVTKTKLKEESKEAFLSATACGLSDSDSQEEPSKIAVKEEYEPSSALYNPLMSSKIECSDSKEGVKAEPNVDSDSSPSSTMDHDDMLSPKSERSSATPTPPPVTETSTGSGSSSKMSTPPLASTPAPPANSRKRNAASAMPTQFIGHLPVAREEAMSTFVEITDNIYQYKTLGRSRELQESMICDCTFDPETDDPDMACGHGSDCINRLTQIECLPEDCRCRSYCQNQRFQHKEYASIEIVKTEMKGFGLRAEEDLPKDTFIYEYVGDVISTSSFKKRMRDYANEGIQHFYFMMLQKDEFIDATKSGGIGRFANHSCNPNCYVAKWTIGDYVRMGIFAKRNIKKNEELTFNYNVDRYGHQAQTCYCGEPNCVGYIGGKTQTDISTMDELYLDALGITDDAELMELKGTKKKKGKKIDDPDFMPQMKPVTEKDVPKVVQAIRQTQSKKVLYKLLTRLKITEDQAALRQVMRLRGYSLMKNILEDYADDVDILASALECMWAWPLSYRNKVEDSQVVVPVKTYTESENKAVKQWATKLHEHWATLELSYRIPRLPKQALPKEEEKTEPEPTPPPTPPVTRDYHGYIYQDERPSKRSRHMHPEARKRPHPHTGFPGPVNPEPKEPSPPPGPDIQQLRLEALKKQNLAINEIIAAAAAEKAEAVAAAEAAALAQAEKEKERAEKEAERERRRKERGEGGGGGSSSSKKRDREKRKREKGESEQDKEALREKRLLKLISPVVVKYMSKHAEVIGHDRFKRHAKELTEKIAASEKKSSAYRHNQLDALSDEKVAKIKKYAKQYIEKVLHRLESKHQSERHRKPSALTGHSGSSMTPSALQNTPSTSTGTPNSADLPPTMAEVDLDDSMDMDMNSDSGSEIDDEDGDDEVHGQADDFGKDDISTAAPSAMEDIRIADDDMMDAMDQDTPIHSQRASDPRQRPPNDNVDGLS